MNWLMDLDRALMRFLNVEWIHPLLDQIVPLFSDFDVWIIPFIILLIVIVIKWRLKGVFIVAGLGLTVLLSETMSTRVVKELVGRIRPCHIHEWVRLVGSYCPNSAAFTSTHAANITAAITFLSFFFPRWLLFVMVPLATIVGYSRVYKGVHYPLDVIGGAILGIGCGWGIYMLLKKLIFPRFGIEVKPAPSNMEGGIATKKRQERNKR